MFRFIKTMYYRRLFLRIYFAHLKHPNLQDTEYALTLATADFMQIKEHVFKEKPTAKKPK